MIQPIPRRIVFLVVLAVACAFCVACSGARKRERTEFDIHLANAQRYYDAARYAQAEQQVRKALDLRPRDRKARLILAWSMLQQDAPDKLPESLEMFEKLVRQYPKERRAHLGLGSTRYKLALLRESRIETLAEEEPEGSPEIELAVRQRDAYLDLAEKDFELVLRRWVDDPTALSILGQIEALRGNPGEAIPLLTRFLDLAEKTRRSLERMRVRREDEVDLEILDRKIERNIAREVRHRDLLANIYYDQGLPEKSIEQLDRILAIDPDWSDAYLHRARCWAKADRYERAVADIEHFLRRTERNFEDPVVQNANELLRDYAAKL